MKSYSDLIKDDIEALKTQLVSNDHFAQIDSNIATAAQWLIDNIKDINVILQNTPVQEKSDRIEALEEGQTKWIKEGITLHFDSDYKGSTCLFCDSKTTNIDELIKHFSDEVVNSINIINGYLKKIEDYTTGFAKVESATQHQKRNINLLRKTFDELTPVLQEKRNSISSKKEPITLDNSNLQELITIDPIDLITTAYTIESHYVAEQYEAYDVARIEHEKSVKVKQMIEEEVKTLTSQVRTLKQKAKSIHEPASALNCLFKVVFPYRKIEITDSDDGTGYILKRDEENCDFSSLSEGEKKFISLAYFIYSINDAQNKLSNDGLVVIDDPVSSLDKQAIFQIFSMIVDEIKKHQNRQYLILTHNLDFLGHLKENFRKKIDKDEVRLFGFTTTNDGCVIEVISPLDHRSDYYYVFSVLDKFKDKCDMEDVHLVVNLLRRWIETFLEFKFSTSGDLQSTLEFACAEASKITKEWKTPFNANHLEIYRFINHGSRGFPDTESTDDSILTNANQRIKEVFQLVKILDPFHYKKLKTMVERL